MGESAGSLGMPGSVELAPAASERAEHEEAAATPAEAGGDAFVADVIVQSMAINSCDLQILWARWLTHAGPPCKYPPGLSHPVKCCVDEIQSSLMALTTLAWYMSVYQRPSCTSESVPFLFFVTPLVR
eukprot:scaffold477489_cov15-Prasinocladus_malaysianus.AAC.1